MSAEECQQLCVLPEPSMLVRSLIHSYKSLHPMEPFILWGPRAREETRSLPSPRHTTHFRCSGTPSWSSSTSPLPRVRPRFASVSTSLLMFRGLAFFAGRRGAFVTWSFNTARNHATKQPSATTLRVPRRQLSRRDRRVPALPPPCPGDDVRAKAEGARGRESLYIRPGGPKNEITPPSAELFSA